MEAFDLFGAGLDVRDGGSAGINLGVCSRITTLRLLCAGDSAVKYHHTTIEGCVCGDSLTNGEVGGAG